MRVLVSTTCEITASTDLTYISPFQYYFPGARQEAGGEAESGAVRLQEHKIKIFIITLPQPIVDSSSPSFIFVQASLEFPPWRESSGKLAREG